MCVCLCAEEARFHEVTISLSVERATGVGRERVLGVILSLVEDAFGPRHSCQRYPHSSGFPCGEFPQEENTVTSHYPPHRHCDRLGTSRDQTFTKVKRASYHVTRTGGRKYKSKTFLKFVQMS